MRSFGVTKSTSGFELYLRLPMRNREFLWSMIAMIVVFAFSAIIVVMAWSDIWVCVIGWIAFSIFLGAPTAAHDGTIPRVRADVARNPAGGPE